MHALVEEYARGAVQLRYYDSFRSVDYECAGRRHVRDIAEIHILDPGIEVLVLWIGARKAEFCLQRNIVCKSSFKTFVDRILRRVDEVVNELQLVVVPRIFDREYFLKHLEKTFVLPVFRRRLQLEEILERFQLNFQKVRIFQNFRGSEHYSLIVSLF